MDTNMISHGNPRAFSPAKTAPDAGSGTPLAEHDDALRAEAAGNPAASQSAQVEELMRQRQQLRQAHLELEAEQQRLQQALDEAEAATLAKSEFLSRMSHEIRTPLNAIIGMTAIAKESRSDFQQVVECLDKIDTSSHFLLTLINDILEMSRIESGRLHIQSQPFAFSTLENGIRTVVEPLAMQGDIRYEYLPASKVESRYVGDMMRVQQVLVNLIANAIKFTKPGGRVRFSVEIEGQTPQAASFKFVVADTGIGMSAKFMERMFQPFTQEDGSSTSAFGGSGLGLAISKSLVDAMGGTIEADSFRGVGTTFTVRLPLQRIQAASAAPADGQPCAHVDESVLDGAHVLIAEDHPLNVLVACKLLERRNIKFTVAKNGQEACQAFQAAEPYCFDAILMDIRMPVMDGLDAARRIRALDRPDALSVPIIAMTANALEDDRRRTLDAGMNDHLAKPFDPAAFYGMLAQHIGKAVSQ